MSAFGGETDVDHIPATGPLITRSGHSDIIGKPAFYPHVPQENGQMWIEYLFRPAGSSGKITSEFRKELACQFGTVFKFKVSQGPQGF